VSRLDNFLGKGKDPVDKYAGWEKLVGKYGCKSCPEYSEYAYYDGVNGVLAWTCPDNHESVINL